MIAVNFLDNVLRPLVIVKGLTTPMPVRAWWYPGARFDRIIHRADRSFD
jgi:hypothetical protein